MVIKNIFPVSVIMEKRPSTNKWADNYWKAIGVIVGEQTATELTLIQEQGDTRQYLIPGFQVQLYKDQCERWGKRSHLYKVEVDLPQVEQLCGNYWQAECGSRRLICLKGKSFYAL